MTMEDQVDPSTTVAGGLTAEWCAEHFDHESHMRAHCPVTHTDQHEGFWVVTKYDDVMRVAQDWRTFSSADGVGVIPLPMAVTPLPEVSDPPIQQAYKRLINPYFTPKVVGAHEEATRAYVNEMIDEFIDEGECEFMSAFASPYPGRIFFEQYLSAPKAESERMNELTMLAVMPGNPDRASAWKEMFEWIVNFVAERRAGEPKGDVVDAVIAAEVDDRSITDTEIYGIIQLLILGGLDTTAGALGQFMIRFCNEPWIAQLLRDQPELLDDAVEELLRLEGPFVGIGRKATTDTEIRGNQVGEGERVLCYWASANRDEDHFEDPHDFRLDRESNRHLAFGIGTHRCAGSNVARMNLRIAVREILDRMHDIELAVPAEDIQYHTVFNRAPLEVPIRFTKAG
jgi:cytochrome P450